MVLNLPISLQTQNFARPGPLCEPQGSVGHVVPVASAKLYHCYSAKVAMVQMSTDGCGWTWPGGRGLI